MVNPLHRPLTIDTKRYFVLAPMPPFVDICLQSARISRRDFAEIIELAGDYQNDPRLIEMVKKAGDASAKVPYLMDADESADSILETLREIARPHVEHLQSLPPPVQATIHLLLSINAVPRGYQRYGLPALLEIDCIQSEMTGTLHALMKGRVLARDFHHHNFTALERLDHDWPHLRAEKSHRWPNSPLPETAQMQYRPLFDKADRLVHLHETCVIVDAPDAPALKCCTPSVLQHPLPANVPVPTTGSADWLIREVGKVGRHFTRALLGIIKARLGAEHIALEASNYDLINRHAQDALREFMESRP